MALRKTILTTGEVYHVLNRSVQGIPIFKGKREMDLFLEAAEFYLQTSPQAKFSLYRQNKDRFPIKLNKRLVTIINFCLMSNHFHFTLRQETEKGITKFMHRLSNSFSHYFNKKYKKSGAVFEGNFRAVRVDTGEQLLHLSRYIHLNPVTACLVEKPEDHLYSSYRTYIEELPGFKISDPSLVLSEISPEDYKKFVLARKDYQRNLERIKHLIMEEA